jgi:predicted XRE-type DNA-binding protein
VIEQLTELLDRLGDASSLLRRAEAHQLRAEGFTQTRIAETFGVSRQRAATLLMARAGRRPGKRDRA